MKTNLTILMLGLASVLGGRAQDCQKFRTGTFVNVDNGIEKAHVKRTETNQFEYNEKTGAKLSLKVVWINDCTYELHYIKANSVWKDQIGDAFDPDLVLVVTITEVGEDYYMQSSYWKGKVGDPYITRMELKM